MINPNSLYANDRFCRWTSWFITPAVKEDSCEEDHQLIISRVVKVAIVLFAGSFFTGALVSVYCTNRTIKLIDGSIPFLACILSVFMTYVLNRWLASRAANAKAVNEYLTLPYPSYSATRRIQDNFAAAQLLINKKGDINKFNEIGGMLLANIWNFDIFKLLIDYGMDLKIYYKNNCTLFQYLLLYPIQDYVKYVLTNKKVKAEDFDATEQVKFWIMLTNAQTGYLLNQCGFDVNIRDNNGHTPLMKLAIENNGGGGLDICTHVTLLLNCGADPLMTIKEGQVEKNALELFHDHPAVQKILQAHQKKNKV